MDGIIWHSHDLKIFLLDIPGSIAAAQGTKALPSTARLLSNRAREKPYNPIVPKSETAKQNVDSNASKKIEELHELYKPEMMTALEQVKDAMNGRAWCKPRRCGVGIFEVQAYKKHRKRYALYDELNFEIPKDILKSIVSEDPFTQQVRRQQRGTVATQTVFNETNFDAVFHNAEDHIITLTLKPDIDDFSVATVTVENHPWLASYTNFKHVGGGATHQEGGSSHEKDNADATLATVPQGPWSYGKGSADSSVAPFQANHPHAKDNLDANTVAVPQDSSAHAKDNTDATTTALQEDSSTQGQDNTDATTAAAQKDYSSPGKHDANTSAAAPQKAPQDDYSQGKANTHITSDDSAHNFRIPPGSTFVLADCTRGHTFRSAVQDMHHRYDTPKRFDLIIMDPPWTNSSAQASGSYRTHRGNGQTRSMFAKMDLDAYIAPGGFICVWVTNSEKARDAVLGPDGLFAMTAASLVEEWIWIKTTARGEPQSTIDSKWRKPYEVLLIGQAALDQGSCFPPTGAWPVNRRVLAAVPDLHSRKPCLKAVLERIWGKSEGEYTALEIFARTCVAGWWSWGNEVIKYNWEKYWVDGEEERKQVKKGKKSAQDFSQLLGEGEEKKKKQTEKNGEEKEEAEEKAATKAVVGEKRKASSLEE